MLLHNLPRYDNLSRMRRFTRIVFDRDGDSESVVLDKDETNLVRMTDNIACSSFVCLLLLVTAMSVVHSQFPRFEFGDAIILVNNSYIPHGDIGEGVNDSLRCVTNNTDCCINGQGNWFDEREIIVEDSDMVNVSRGDGVVYLNHKTNESLLGLWRCDIPDNNNISQSIYIYLGSQTKGIILKCSL